MVNKNKWDEMFAISAVIIEVVTLMMLLIAITFKSGTLYMISLATFLVAVVLLLIIMYLMINTNEEKEES